MGQRPSNLGGATRTNKPQLPLTWFFRGERNETTHNPNPEQPIRFQYKTRRKCEQNNIITKQCNNNNNVTATTNLQYNNLNQSCTNNNNNNSNNKIQVKNTNLNESGKCRIIKTQNLPTRTKSEPSLGAEKVKENRHRHRRRTGKLRRWGEDVQQFGYEIQDVDDFLTKATIEKPANIPVVLAFPSVLYQTRIGGYQAEISLPLGMVVNAVFKNQHWLYVQTPHAEEGYVSYAACLPLGIIPPPEDDDSAPAPCWEKSTDVFPKPSGNMTDTEKLSSRSECGGNELSSNSCHRTTNTRRSRNAISACGERSVDRLYLRAASVKNNLIHNNNNNNVIRQTLLVIISDYFGEEKGALHVRKGDVVVLLATHVRGWFWVKNKDGQEGFIPAAVAGHGFL